MNPLILLAGLAAAALALSGSSGGGQKDPNLNGHSPSGGAPPNPWDQNLSPEEVLAIGQALNFEGNPDTLDAFSKSMLPDHPIAAAALAARALLVRGLAHPGASPGPLGPIGPLPIPPPVLPHPLGGDFPPIPMPVMPPAPPPMPLAPASTNATVTTHDTGPSGNLNVRDTPNGNVIGQYAHGERVAITGPATSGFYPTAGMGTSGTPIAGFASAQFVTADMTAPGAPDLQGLLQGVLDHPGAPILSHVQTATVTTHDTGAAGNLNVRDMPGGTVIGQVAHGAQVVITGPQSGGFYPITGQSVAGHAIAGFASAQFITPAPTTISAGFAGAAPSLVQVSTGGASLGLRAHPDARAPYVAQAPHGATFRPAGPVSTTGFVPVRDDAGHVLFAPAKHLAPVTRTGSDVAAGPSSSFAELHDAALQLKTALAVHGCRSHNEPIVKRFQRAAISTGLYEGLPDGWYGTKTQGALAQVVGKPAPACFDEPTGGPTNPQEYWSPMGA